MNTGKIKELVINSDNQFVDFARKMLEIPNE